MGIIITFFSLKCHGLKVPHVYSSPSIHLIYQA